MIGLMAMVPMIIALQGSVSLVQTCPHRWGPFEVGEVLDDGQELVIGAVESSEMGGALLAFALAAFLFRQALSSQLATLGGYHDCLRGGPDVIFQRREFIRPSI